MNVGWALNVFTWIQLLRLFTFLMTTFHILDILDRLLKVMICWYT